MHDLASGRDELFEELMDETSSFEALDFNEAETVEEEIATQLLEATSDAELDHFFGGLLKKAKGLMRSPAGKLLRGALRGVAKKALPTAGAALGNMIAPGLGGSVGAQFGGMLGSQFEGEAISDEDVQLEVAKRIVRSARQAAGTITRDPRVMSDPKAAVQAGLLSAIRRNLPGLSNAFEAGAASAGAQSGRWYRNGNRIIIVGV